MRRDLESGLDNKTLLPTSRYVKKALKRVLASKNKAVLIIEVENLKNYKSVYTEVAADKLLQTFVAIAKSALSEIDFIGQLDETNFVIVTNKYNAEKLASFLTFAFDTVVPKFYSEEDAKRGYMLMESERFAGMRANFVSIVIGGLIEGFELINSVELLIERLQEIKRMAKITSGSHYVIERAKLTAADSVLTNISNKTVYIREQDESLRYLIKTALELQGYDVQDDLDINTAIQPSVIIFDGGEELCELEYLKQLRNSHNYSNTKIIVTTTIHNKTAVLDAGADLYLPKPYEIADLIGWIEFFQRH